MSREIAVGIAIGVGSTLIVMLLLRLAHVFDAGKNARKMRTEVGRAYKDYELWATRRDRQLAEELRAIDEDHNDHGTYNSGARLAAHAKAREEATLDNREAMDKRSRAIDDAFQSMRKVDLVWVTLTLKNVGWGTRLKGVWTTLTKSPVSMEQMVDEAWKAEGGS